jgi:DNA-binding GntR family transcriptional regulator
LRDFLMAGQVQPGQMLTLRELAAALGVSPMPVREAVGRLAAEGGLEALPNRRVRVPILTRSRFRELLAIRLAVEGLAVEKAVGRIRDQDIDRMEELNAAFTAEMAAARPDPHRLFRLNKDLHYILYQAADAPDLLGIIEGLWIKIGPLLQFSLRVRANSRGRNPAPDWHARLIRGLRRRDPVAARRAIEGDLNSAADQILAQGNLPD